jgi:eukaryotic-like serine/threonine-protein kinase
VGRLLFRVARAFMPARALPPPATHRATELALALAAERLFEELPRATRTHLRDLPDVVRRLEGEAQRLRHRLDELQDALAGPGTGESERRRDRIVTDLEGERDVVQRRLGDAVKALETIRLNLLRLHAGSGSVQSLTTDLGLAREVADEIGRQLAAQREVDEALR